MAKKTVIISRSTAWARANKEIIAERSDCRRRTLSGKLTGLLTQSRYRTKKRDFEHTITLPFLKEMYEHQNGRCVLSGNTMTIYGPKGSNDYWHSISLDRVNSSLGYTPDNVQLVCTGVNIMKQEMPNELFIDFCRKVASTHV
jgi:hypothetical protein